jgi:hypothetical protein
MLLQHAEDDLESPGSLRRAVEDLTSLRAGKIRRFVQISVRDRVNAVRVNELSSFEIEANRPVLCKVLESLYAMQVPELEGELVTQSTSAGASSTAGGTEARPAQPRELRRVIRR